MTSLRLRLAAAWLPEWMLKSQLERVSDLTTHALLSLLKEKIPDHSFRTIPPLRVLSGSIEDCRGAMALNHNTLVQSLVEAIGEKDAIDLGRQALFKAGLEIGEESRARLGVGEKIDDLITAARLLYRVLGINFTVQQNSDEFKMEVARCALSKWYSEQTCRMLSAVDEGVVRGLNHKIGMRFDRMITSGFATCIARIWIDPGGLTC